MFHLTYITQASYFLTPYCPSDKVHVEVISALETHMWWMLVGFLKTLLILMFDALSTPLPSITSPFPILDNVLTQQKQQTF